MPTEARATEPQDDRAFPGASPQAPAIGLAAALGGLDRATRNFTRRLGEAQDLAGAPAPAPVSEPAPAAAPTPISPPAFDSRWRSDRTPARPVREPAGRPAAEQAFEARLREAEREAREYLERAKQRADSLVAAMVSAVEQEAAGIRRDAEAGIRSRWQQVETDAARHLEEARRVGDGMVAERQQRLAALSDGITGKAEALSTGLDDADRVRRQFDAFVRALSVTADQIAADPRAPAESAFFGELHALRRRPRPSALAA